MENEDRRKLGIIPGGELKLLEDESKEDHCCAKMVSSWEREALGHSQELEWWGEHMRFGQEKMVFSIHYILFNSNCGLGNDCIRATNVCQSTLFTFFRETQTSHFKKQNGENLLHFLYAEHKTNGQGSKAVPGHSGL